MLLSIYFLKAQNIEAIEYFLDADPGYGLGNPVTVSGLNSDESNLTIAIDIASLQNGIHKIFIRSKAGNIWSSVQSKNIFKKVSSITQLIKIEYFIDSDPGPGAATNVPFTRGSEISNLHINDIELNSITDGLHQIYFRSQDQTGQWSLISSQLIYVSPNLSSNINKLEYFIDADPGEGLATQISISASPNQSELIQTIDINNLSTGIHILYVRSKDNFDKWSIIEQHMLYKSSGITGDITKLEYFIDDDPGFGQGVPIGIIPSQNIANQSAIIPIENLPIGFHHLYVRSKDDWGITDKLLFYKTKNLPAAINKIEYFIDADPGVGMGTQITGFTSGNDLQDFTFAVNISGYSFGDHYIFLRSRDSIGNWSLTNVFQFENTTALPVTWMNFSVELDSKDEAHINWEVANSINTLHYIIQKSQKINSFKNIATVNSIDSYKSTSYSFVDNAVSPGINYYRIKQEDHDGKYEYSEIRSIDLRNKYSNHFIIKNNPSSQPILSSSQTGDILIFNSIGKLVTRTQISKNIDLQLSQMSSGQYICVMMIEANVIQAQKLIIID